MKWQKLQKWLLAGLFVGLVFLVGGGASTLLADNLESPQYQIEFSNINFSSGAGSSDNYDLSTTVGQTAANEFSSSGYIVKAGFQYISSIIPFEFEISDTSIDFGTLSPNTPATGSTVLTVKFGGAGSYQVTAAEVGKLRTFGNTAEIPDTVCNGGGDTCSESTADVWTSTSAYGFGYNMAGTSVPGDFTDATYFRPFADLTIPETPVVVMTSVNVTTQSQATMTMKANISSTQAAGSYQTIVKFVATPSF